MDAAGVLTDKKYTGGHMVVWCGVVWCAVETVEWYAATPTMVGNRGLRGTQQAQNSTATGDIQHIET